MVAAVESLPPDVQAAIEVRVWNINTRPGVMRKLELKVKAIPGIVLNGETAFASLIPTQEELSAAIRARGAPGQKR